MSIFFWVATEVFLDKGFLGRETRDKRRTRGERRGSGLTGGDGGPGLACRPAIRKVKQRKEIKKKKKEDKQKEKWRAGPGLPSCLGGPWPEVNPDPPEEG